uniref:Uncharacterized protein n=1 Tax=Ditylenchus dipsaci TaxID=166011 RepID=A0A915CS92_9BILA
MMSAPKSPLPSPVNNQPRNQSSSSASVEVVGQPWNYLLVISQPQVEASSEESKQLSNQWKSQPKEASRTPSYLLVCIVTVRALVALD